MLGSFVGSPTTQTHATVATSTKIKQNSSNGSLLPGSGQKSVVLQLLTFYEKWHNARYILHNSTKCWAEHMAQRGSSIHPNITKNVKICS